MKNKNKIILGITMLSILLLLLLGSMIFLLKGNKIFSMNYHLFGKVSNHLILDETYSNDWDQIIIDQQAGDIELKNSTDDQIRVIVYGKEENLKINSDYNLSIKYQDDSCKFFCINKEQSKIEIYLPSSYQKEVKIENRYGDIKVEKLPKAKLKINADCGDILVEEIERLFIESAYGDIKINKANEAEIEEDCGDVVIKEVNSLKIENNYGDIDIGKVTKYLDIKEDCGDISIDSVEIQKDSTIINSYGDIKIERINNIYIDAKTSLGDTDIATNNRTADITLKIRNSCGDIEVGE